MARVSRPLGHKTTDEFAEARHQARAAFEEFSARSGPNVIELALAALYPDARTRSLGREEVKQTLKKGCHQERWQQSARLERSPDTMWFRPDHGRGVLGHLRQEHQGPKSEIWSGWGILQPECR